MVEGVAVGDAERAGIVASVFERYAAQFVHRAAVADDMLWPVLAARDDRSHEVVARIRGKRAAIIALLEDADAELRTWRRSDAASGERARLAGTLARVHGAMVDVLDDEIVALLPIIERDLSSAEWRSLTRATRASASRREFVVQMGWVMDGLETAERADFLRSLTLGQRLSWRLGGRRRWQQQRDRCYDL